MMQMYHGHGAGITRHLAENCGPRGMVDRWVADRASLCSQLVDLGEGATGAGRRADREVYLRVRESVARSSDH